MVYLVYKDRSVWLKDNAVEALNFSILYTVAQVLASMLTLVVIGAILLPLVFIAAWCSASWPRWRPTGTSSTATR